MLGQLSKGRLSKGQLSKGLLFKETFVQGDYCPSNNDHTGTVYWRMQARGKRKYIMRFEIR